MSSSRGGGRVAVRRRRRAAERAESFVAGYRFSDHLGPRVAARLGLDESSWNLIEAGLREWFICCGWRGLTVLGMPSRAVDEAWHEFILDTIRYVDFCERAYGDYLHHTPDAVMSTPMNEALADTVRAWDRSGLGEGDRESVLWDLDRKLAIDRPFGVSGVELAAIRNGNGSGDAAWACATGRIGYLVGDGFAGSGGWEAGAGGHGGGGHGGGGHGGGGCGGGSGGCGGGGCGGGGCGGGGCGGGGS